jgi:hypothetical protein
MHVCMHAFISIYIYVYTYINAEINVHIYNFKNFTKDAVTVLETGPFLTGSSPKSSKLSSPDGFEFSSSSISTETCVPFFSASSVRNIASLALKHLARRSIIECDINLNIYIIHVVMCIFLH